MAFIVLVMGLPLLKTSATTTTVKSEKALKKMFDKSSESKIRLGANIKTTTQFQIIKGVHEIDLNGYSLSGGSTAITLEGSAQLTIKSSKRGGRLEGKMKSSSADHQ